MTTRPNAASSCERSATNGSCTENRSAAREAAPTLLAQKGHGHDMRHELERSPTEKLIIEDTEYKGHNLVTLRIYFLSKEDEWLPTKKGVTFRRDQLDEVLEALNKIKEQS
ncbi:hypothetical protein GF420_13635 [candidate division GN15 bacterium]|nr:hypothetical protein [candidate division GN15 bacterium]